MAPPPENAGLNEAERFVADHCRRSFLSLWTYPNPQGHSGKELCDLLTVCDPDVIVISVKHVDFKDTGRPEVDLTRWWRRAVDESVKQVFGAERCLNLDGEQHRVTTMAGKAGLTIPAKGRRRLHRVAVALGGDRKVLFASGPVEGRNRYVHVLDGPSFATILRELDTISDFAAYLTAKEGLQAQVMTEGEEDLLAVYLQNGREFPDKDSIFLDGGVWQSFSQSKQYEAKRDADEISYVWDRLIETFCQDQHASLLLGGHDIDAVEQALRTMAREDRFTRRGLGKSFYGFLEANQQGRARARIHPDPGLATYVFLGCPVDFPRKDRVAELKARCLIARWLHPDKAEVVGIAMETPKPGQGFSLDLMSLLIPELTPEQAALAEQWQQEFGYFKKMRYCRRREEEYPN
jgi:hypothetical protein